MRRILLVGAGVIALLLISLSMLEPMPARVTEGGLPAPLAAVAPSGCLPGTQQCSPVVPQPTAGPSPVLLLAATLAVAAAALVAQARVRHRRDAAPLPSGFAVTIPHPPRTPRCV